MIANLFPFRELDKKRPHKQRPPSVAPVTPAITYHHHQKQTKDSLPSRELYNNNHFIIMQKLQINIIISCLAVVVVVISLILSTSTIAAVTPQSQTSIAHSNNQNQQQNASNAARPYWHKPGCHQVGHTRTISIPGCVKFNLSTNACRGFCVSFSIPASEDIGPLPADQLDGPTAGIGSTPLLLSGAKSAGTITLNRPPQGTAHFSEQEAGSGVDEAPLPATAARQMIERRRSSSLTMDETRRRTNSHNNDDNSKQIMTQVMTKGGDFWHLTGKTKSPLAGVVGDLSDKRDVISVGQCCNMMETEDVTVNLRCGLNETRRLVFKSAKTCECFFCKHV